MMWRNSAHRWGWLGISIHWLSALTVIGLFALGLWMVDLTYYDSWYRDAPFIHKSVGVSLFLLTLLRLLWRWLDITPRHLDSHTRFEQKAARLAHVFIYLLLFGIMLSGYLISTADGRAIEVFNLFSVPATMQGRETQEELAGEVHEVLAWTLIAVVLVHAGAALKHHYVDKDETLKRMLGH